MKFRSVNKIFDHNLKNILLLEFLSKCQRLKKFSNKNKQNLIYIIFNKYTYYVNFTKIINYFFELLFTFCLFFIIINKNDLNRYKYDY